MLKRAAEKGSRNITVLIVFWCKLTLYEAFEKAVPATPYFLSFVWQPFGWEKVDVTNVQVGACSVLMPIGKGGPSSSSISFSDHFGGGNQ
jgi:hypothetical protein